MRRRGAVPEFWTRIEPRFRTRARGRASEGGVSRFSGKSFHIPLLRASASLRLGGKIRINNSH